MSKFSSVYFYCLPQGEGSRPAYQFQSISLAQGLQKLGLKIYSNLNYWKTSYNDEQYLFNYNPNVSSADCDIIVVPCQWYQYGKTLPIEELKKASKSIKILIDVSDGLYTPAFEAESRIFDVILKQKSKGIKYPENCIHPWMFGLTDELIEITSDSPQFKNRNKSILVNFRHKHPIRSLAKENFVANIEQILISDTTIEKLDMSYKSSNIEKPTSNQELLYIQSGGRHYIKYIERMKNAMACAAFGGVFMLGDNKENNKFYNAFANYFIAGRAGGKITQALEKMHFQITHTYNVYQWDSWRFWESLASGCVTFHLDFEKYGMELPVMPVNWKHYIGIDLLKPKESIEKLKSMTVNELEQIGINGREWALNNYSPEAAAKLFLSYLE